MHTIARVTKVGVGVVGAVLAAGILIAQPPASPQDADKSHNGVLTPGKTPPPKDDAANQRTIEGIVTDATQNPIARAIVQLKDTRTLQIRSFITQADGTYRFAGLRFDVDYELKAVVGDQSTPSKRVSSFESRKIVSVNLALEKK